MKNDEIPTSQHETSSELAGFSNSIIEGFIPPVPLDTITEISLNLFTGIFLIAEYPVRLKFVYWIRLFAHYGGIILGKDDRNLATHVLHADDEECFEDVENYYDVRHAVHVNVEWLVAALRKGRLQNDRPYRVVLLPGKRSNE